MTHHRFPRFVWRARRQVVSGGHGGRGMDGYNLVVLAVMVTILNILVAMALPSWGAIIQREKEAELIFRGLQYAEAIRVFQLRNNRLPNQLEELVEVTPRSIRQLWKNPMAKDGAWRLVLGAPQQPGGQPAQQLSEVSQDTQQRMAGSVSRQQIIDQRRAQAQGGRDGQQGGDGDDGTAAGGRMQPATGPGNTRLTGRVIPGAERGQGKNVVSGPIIGVASPDGDKAFHSFLGSQQIKEWQFRLELLNSVQLISDQGPEARPINSSTVGRPWPPGVNPRNTGQGVQQQPNNRFADPNSVERHPGGLPVRNPGNPQSNPRKDQ